MNTKKKIFTCLAAIFLIGLFAQTAIFAAPPVVKPAVTQVKPLKTPVDLIAHYIEYFNCPCTLAQALDTEYISDMIAVKVGNGSLATEIDAKISLTYFSIPQNRMITIVKNVRLGRNQHPKIIMVNTPLLIKKSLGVTATIEHTSANFTDPNPGNNRVVQKTCGQMVE